MGYTFELVRAEALTDYPKCLSSSENSDRINSQGENLTEIQ